MFLHVYIDHWLCVFFSGGVMLVRTHKDGENYLIDFLSSAPAAWRAQVLIMLPCILFCVQSLLFGPHGMHRCSLLLQM